MTVAHGWTEATLGELLQSIDAGLNVACIERPPEEGEAGLVKISAVTWGKFDELQSKTLPINARPNPKYRIIRGDLLISRANTMELVGASVIVANVKRELYLSDKVLRLNVPESFKRWVNYALKTPAVRDAIQEASSGNQLSMRNISQNRLRSLKFPLAPEAEQVRIVDKLDTVLARTEAARIRLKRVPTLLKRFRQSVLAAATNGTLTAEWRAIRGLSADYDARDLSLEEVTKGVEQGWSPKCDNEPAGNEHEWAVIKTTSIQAMRFDDFENKRLPKTLTPREHLVIYQGDLLITRAGPRVRAAVSCLVRKTRGRLLLCDKAYRFRSNESILKPEFLEIYLNSPACVEVLNSLKTGISESGVNLTQQKFLELRIVFPSLPEQDEIIRRVQSLFAVADKIQAQYDRAIERLDKVTRAALAKAFRGELVPQNPDDEPAEKILERLRAQANASVSTTKKTTASSIKMPPVTV